MFRFGTVMIEICINFSFKKNQLLKFLKNPDNENYLDNLLANQIMILSVYIE